jgi:hypothetical protein
MSHAANLCGDNFLRVQLVLKIRKRKVIEAAASISFVDRIRYAAAQLDLASTKSTVSQQGGRLSI